jgi:regulatory protein
VPDDLERCRVAALRILSYRWNSAAELRRKLAAKRFDEDVVEATIAALRDEKWLDDDRFAEAFVRSKAQKRLGSGRIGNELRAAGVDADTAARAINANLDPEKEAEGLKAACDRKMRSLARRLGDDFLATPEGRNKLTGYLLKQGYDGAAVSQLVRDRAKRARSQDPAGG